LRLPLQTYCVSRLKSDHHLIDSDNQEIDFLVRPLQQEADRLGLGEQYAQSLQHPELLASTSDQDPETIQGATEEGS